MSDFESGESETTEGEAVAWAPTHAPLGFEVFELEGPALLMQPSQIMSALALGLNLRSDDIGMVAPLRPGVVSLEIQQARAAVLATPRHLGVRSPGASGQPGKWAHFTLRRPNDEPDIFETGRFDALVSFESDPAPSPSELVAALASALGLAGEDLGFALEGAGYLRVSLPLTSLSRVRDGLEVDSAGRTLRIKSLAKKP